MSAPKFRVGDVVCWRNNPGEARVTYVPEQSELYVHVEWLASTRRVEGERTQHHAGFLTLLRRPVQVGDVLRAKEDEKHWDNLHILTIEADRWTGRRGHEDVFLRFSDALGPLSKRGGYTHEDGTPIDPPQPEQPSFESIQLQGEHGPIQVTTKRYGVTADDPDGGLRRERDAERQRANRLADECGRLADENRELRCELADALRKVARLERKRGER